MSQELEMVEMTAEQKAQFEAFKKEQEKKERQEAKKVMRQQLQTMTDEVMADAVAQLKACSASLEDAKKRVMETFSTLIELRKEVNEEEGKREQDSYMFSSSDGTKRIRIGYNMNDGYLDQVEVGISKVKCYLESLATDDRSREIVGLVMRLMARDTKGNLKASRVIQLGQLAERSGDEVFQEGIRIIKEAYRPTRSKLYIRCSVREKDENGMGGWKDVPLGITEV